MAKKKSKKTGPKPVKLTDDDIEKIERMAATGLTMTQISYVWHRGKRTFERYMKEDKRLEEAIHRGRLKANMNVANVAYRMAISGESPAMTMFWLKCRANWKDKMHITGEVDTGPSVQIYLPQNERPVREVNAAPEQKKETENPE